MLPEPAWLNHHACIASLRKRINLHDRSAEIRHVQLALEISWNLRAKEVHDERFALWFYVYTSVGVRKVNDDASFSARPTSKIDVAQTKRRAFGFCRPSETPRFWRRIRRRSTGRVKQRNGQFLSVRLHLIGLRFRQIEHHARATLRLNNVVTPENGVRHVVSGFTYAGCVREIKNQPGRRRNRKHRRRARWHVFQRKSQCGSTGGAFSNGYVLNYVLRKRGAGDQHTPQHARDERRSTPLANYAQ